jgi:hypothetical protein
MVTRPATSVRRSLALLVVAAGRVTVFLFFAYTDHFVGFTWSTTTMRLNDRGTWDHVFTPC